MHIEIKSTWDEKLKFFSQKQKDIYFCVDGAQSVPHMKVDFKTALFGSFSGLIVFVIHKVFSLSELHFLVILLLLGKKIHIFIKI